MVIVVEKVGERNNLDLRWEPNPAVRFKVLRLARAPIDELYLTGIPSASAALNVPHLFSLQEVPRYTARTSDINTPWLMSAQSSMATRVRLHIFKPIYNTVIYKRVSFIISLTLVPKSYTTCNLYRNWVSC